MKKTQIQELTEAVEKLINHPVAPIAPVLPIAPIAPIAPIDNSVSSDLLIKFARIEETVKIKFEQVFVAIKEIKDGTTGRIESLENDKLDSKDSYFTLYKKGVDDKSDDHEKRITSGERDAIKKTVMVAIGGIALLTLIGILVTHMFQK